MSVAPERWPRNVALIVLGAYSISRCLAYVGPLSPAQTPTQLVFVDQFIPIWVYATLWAVAAGLAIAAVFQRKFQPAAIGINAGLNFLWGLSFLLAWAFLDQPRSWVTSMSYFAISALTVAVGASQERPVANGRR